MAVSTYKTSAGPGRASSGRSSYGTLTVAVRIVRFKFEQKSVPVRCVQTPAERRPGNVRYPADIILPPMTLLNAVRAPWNFKY